MAQTSVNIRMDSDLKRAFEKVCAEMGFTLTTAVTVFARAVINRREIPFTITADAIPSRFEFTQETEAALHEPTVTFNSMEELMEDLQRDD